METGILGKAACFFCIPSAPLRLVSTPSSLGSRLLKLFNKFYVNFIKD